MKLPARARQFTPGVLALALLAIAVAAGAQNKKPNILVIFGDDIGRQTSAATRMV